MSIVWEKNFFFWKSSTVAEHYLFSTHKTVIASQIYFCVHYFHDSHEVFRIDILTEEQIS